MPPMVGITVYYSLYASHGGYTGLFHPGLQHRVEVPGEGYATVRIVENHRGIPRGELFDQQRCFIHPEDHPFEH